MSELHDILQKILDEREKNPEFRKQLNDNLADALKSVGIIVTQEQLSQIETMFKSKDPKNEELDKRINK